MVGEGAGRSIQARPPGENWLACTGLGGAVGGEAGAHSRAWSLLGGKLYLNALGGL